MRKNAKITKVLVLFYSSFKSPRLEYVLNYLFNQRLGLEYTWINTLESPDIESKIHISYSDSSFKHAWNIQPDNLLKDSQISESVHTQNYKNLNNCNDPFACIFFHLSRYEEYLTQHLDQHGRFPHQQSILFIPGKGIAQLPIVDLLVIQIATQLSQILKTAVRPLDSPFGGTCPTLDIDSAFAYKGRSIYRQIGAISKDILRFRWSECFKRLLVLGKLKNDPNDNFDYQQSVLDNTKAHYFIQCGPFGKFDKNIPLSNPDFQAIIKQLIHNGHEIGLHPSYGSDSHTDKILQEKKLLESTFQIHVKHSRQHFLKMRMPQTYRALIACGIEFDWSMGYSEEYGFRAGTAAPFKWFDLEKNCSTMLTIVPFFVMDVVFKQFKVLNPAQTIERTLEMKQWLKANNLPFVFVFHNESLSQHRGWKGWSLVFEKWVKG